jgi:uncharacterized protein (DUF58 family)
MRPPFVARLISRVVLTATSPIAWGTFPAWVAATGTVLAFAVALYLLFLTVKDRGNSRREDRRAQASLVAAWAHQRYQSGEADWVTLRVRNASNLPVYGLMASISPDLTGKVWMGKSGDVLTLGPGETKSFDVGTKIDPDIFGAPFVRVTFTDNAGLHWKHDDQSGDLVQVSNNIHLNLNAPPHKSPKDHWYSRQKDLPSMI